MKNFRKLLITPILLLVASPILLNNIENVKTSNIQEYIAYEESTNLTEYYAKVNSENYKVGGIIEIYDSADYTNQVNQMEFEWWYQDYREYNPLTINSIKNGEYDEINVRTWTEIQDIESYDAMKYSSEQLYNSSIDEQTLELTQYKTLGSEYDEVLFNYYLNDDYSTMQSSILNFEIEEGLFDKDYEFDVRTYDADVELTENGYYVYNDLNLEEIIEAHIYTRAIVNDEQFSKYSSTKVEEIIIGSNNNWDSEYNFWSNRWESKYHINTINFITTDKFTTTEIVEIENITYDVLDDLNYYDLVDRGKVKVAVSETPTNALNDIVTGDTKYSYELIVDVASSSFSQGQREKLSQANKNISDAFFEKLQGNSENAKTNRENTIIEYDRGDDYKISTLNLELEFDFGLYVGYKILILTSILILVITGILTTYYFVIVRKNKNGNN